MQLLAEAGSTKINWILIGAQNKINFVTSGFNPLWADANYLRQILLTNFPAGVSPDSVNRITYFGTGCGQPIGCERVMAALKGFFKNVVQLEVLTDLEAAARAYIPKTNGIIGILGTGANAGYFEDGKLVTTPYSVGFLLGDEGSGAYLGRHLAASYLRGYFPAGLAVKFEKQFNLTKPTLFDAVYNNQALNRYLAQFVPFLAEHKNEPQFSELIFTAFKRYAKHYIKPLCQANKPGPLIITGGVAVAFSDELVVTLNQCGWHHIKTENNTFNILTAELANGKNGYSK
jgi:glucosamine kinase